MLQQWAGTAASKQCKQTLDTQQIFWRPTTCSLGQISLHGVIGTACKSLDADQTSSAVATTPPTIASRYNCPSACFLIIGHTTCCWFTCLAVQRLVSHAWRTHGIPPKQLRRTATHISMALHAHCKMIGNSYNRLPRTSCVCSMLRRPWGCLSHGAVRTPQGRAAPCAWTGRQGLAYYPDPH